MYSILAVAAVEVVVEAAAAHIVTHATVKESGTKTVCIHQTEIQQGETRSS